jgi:hypothetical protein
MRESAELIKELAEKKAKLAELIKELAEKSKTMLGIHL